MHPPAILALQRSAGNQAVTRALLRKRFTDANVGAKAQDVARTDSRGGDAENYVEAKKRLRAEEIHADTGRADAQANYFQAEREVQDAWNEYQRLGSTGVAPNAVNWPLLEDGLAVEESRQARAIAKLGGFGAVGEGYMTSANMVGSNFRVNTGNAVNDAPLNARINWWTTEGFGNPGQEATDVSMLNRIFGINGPQDARNHRADLVSAYKSLAGSHAAVGQQLAGLLAQPSFTITLQDARPRQRQRGQERGPQADRRARHPLPVPLPLEQGMTLNQTIDSPAPLPAVLMWDSATPTSPTTGPARNARTRPRPTPIPTRRGTLETMAPWVALGHELGHFQDFLTPADAVLPGARRQQHRADRAVEPSARTGRWSART